MLQKGQEKRMKNYNAKTAIEYLAGEPKKKTKDLSMPCMPSIYAVHGSNKPRFYASDEKPEMMLKRERNHYDRRIKND